MSNPNPQATGFGAADGDPLADDPELRHELAAMFLEDGPKQLAEVGAALDKRDAVALKAAAHMLKGSVGVFKDQATFEAASRLEHIRRDSDWPPAEAAWQDLNREFKRLLKVIAAMAGGAGAPAGDGGT